MATRSGAGEIPAIVTAVLIDAPATERAYRLTLDRGYQSDEINLVMSEQTRKLHFSPGQVSSGLAQKARESTETRHAPDATELGGPAGGTVGTIAPAAAAVGTALLFPGLIFAGPIAVALAAAGAVGVAGGLVGALTNWGIPKGHVEAYEAQIRAGGILIGVRPRSPEDAQYLEEQWRRVGGRQMNG